MELHRPRHKSFTVTKQATSTVSSTVNGQATASGLRKSPNDDYGKERQLRDFRRANALCFRCGDKYSKEHQCKKPMQLLTIQLGEFGEIFTEDTVQALELLSESDDVQDTAQCCHLSLQAVSGGEGNETIRLLAQVGNQIMITLVDSGSSHNFINKEFARRAQCQVTTAPPAQVKLANGSLVTCDQQVSQLEWLTHNYTFTTDMSVIELGGYDAVLGMDWLRSCSPMTVDWINKTLRIPHKGSEAFLVGMHTPKTITPTLQTINVEQLRKAHAANDIWALAVLDFSSETANTTVSSDYPPELREIGRAHV